MTQLTSKSILDLEEYTDYLQYIKNFTIHPFVFYLIGYL